MANLSSIVLFFLLLILANEVARIEGRKVELGKKNQTAVLKVMSLDEEGKVGAGSSSVAIPSRNGGQISTKDARDVDAF
ncbi:hypothetical protein AgCh_012506 [Apium graveolens]